MRKDRTAGMRGATLAQVVVAVAAAGLLGLVCLPMLGAGRLASASLLAGWRAGGVARAVESSASDTRWYPPTFRTDGDGTIRHVSAWLLAGGYVPGAWAFTSPMAPGGGAPPAGPYADQVPALAFTFNGAIMPPEPLGPSGTDRHYRLVSFVPGRPQGRSSWVAPHEPIDPASTLLVTEWHAGQGYAALMQGRTVQSHRPIVPFLGVSAGRSPEREPVAGAGAQPFAYPSAEAIWADNADFREALCGRGGSEINAMGRAHLPDNGPADGGEGRAVAVMLDGSVRLVSPRQSVRQRLWGRAFHSITGGQGVR